MRAQRSLLCDLVLSLLHVRLQLAHGHPELLQRRRQVFVLEACDRESVWDCGEGGAERDADAMWGSVGVGCRIGSVYVGEISGSNLTRMHACAYAQIASTNTIWFGYRTSRNRCEV